MLIDILNRQVKSVPVALIVGNAVVDAGLLASLSPDILVRQIARPPGSRNPYYLYKIARCLALFGADVVHAHDPSLIEAMPLFGGKKVLTVHDTGMRFRSSVRRYDLVVSISKAVQADLVTGPMGIESTVVYNGIDFSGITPRQWPGSSGPFRLVQVGRLLMEKKGQDVLLRAVRIVNESLGTDAIRLDFIGDGPDRDALQRLAVELGVGPNCRFLGAIPRKNVYAMLPSYDAVVQPSRYEGFGLTVVEGVAAGLPVLCSDLEGPREILGYVEPRYLFSAQEPEECARQILRVMRDAGAVGFAQKMLANREALQAHFDIEFTANSYLRQYTRLL